MIDMLNIVGLTGSTHVVYGRQSITAKRRQESPRGVVDELGDAQTEIAIIIKKSQSTNKFQCLHKRRF